MFFLKKVITYFVLLPPGNIVLFLTLLGGYLYWKKLKKVSAITLLTALGLYLLSLQPVASLLIAPLEGSYKVPPPERLKSCQALVVLGGGVKVKAPFLELKNDLSEDAFKRLVGAYKLYQMKERPIVVSGYSVRDKVSEAQIMKSLLIYLGVKASDIYTDDRSRDTYENALFTKRILKELKASNFCLITSAYHTPRSVYLFQKVGFKKEQIVPVPVDFKASHSPFTVYKLLPTAYWLNVSAKALKEYFGLLYYKMR